MVDQHRGVAVHPHAVPPSHYALDPRLRGVVTPWHRKQSVRIVATVGICLFIFVCAVAMYLLLGSSFGVGVLTVAVLAAFVPVPILVFGLLWLDRYEPEPWQYLVFTFAWGAFVATLAALIINSTGSELIKDITGRNANNTAAIFIAPPTEETAKAIPLFLMLFLAFIGRRTIHGVIDGIVYAGMAAIGFAFTENVLYFGGAYVEAAHKGNGSDGVVALLATFVMRAIMSPFAHPLFTSMTGIGVGLAAVSKRTAVKVLAPIGGLLLAILLHGTWNTLATSKNLLALGVGYLLVMIPLFIGLISLGVWLRNKEARLVETMLPAYVQRGWFTAAELESLRTLTARRTARRTAYGYGGANAAKAMQEFQLAATKLALLRQSLLRGWAGDDYAKQEQELLSIVVSRRQFVAASAARWVAGSAPSYWPWGGYQGLHAYSHAGYWRWQSHDWGQQDRRGGAR